MHAVICVVKAGRKAVSANTSYASIAQASDTTEERELRTCRRMPVNLTLGGRIHEALLAVTLVGRAGRLHVRNRRMGPGG